MNGFGVAFAGSYLCIVPMMGSSLLQYSQQWQASDVFRVAPLPGPASLCHGARRAILCFLALPIIFVFATIVWFVKPNMSLLPMLLPGMIALPIFALIPHLGGHAILLSRPVEQAKSAGNGVTMFATMMVSFALSGLATWSWTTGWFLWFILAETLIATLLYATLRLSFAKMRWQNFD
jgi:ABC-2 type transport system permease protein